MRKRFSERIWFSVSFNDIVPTNITTVFNFTTTIPQLSLRSYAVSYISIWGIHCVDATAAPIASRACPARVELRSTQDQKINGLVAPLLNDISLYADQNKVYDCIPESSPIMVPGNLTMNGQVIDLIPGIAGGVGVSAFIRFAINEVLD